jgi:hypothetical protein
MRCPLCCIAVSLCLFTNAAGSAQEKSNEQTLKELAELRAEVKALKAEVEALKRAEALVSVKVGLSIGKNDTFGNFMAGQEEVAMKVVRKADGKIMGSLTCCANAGWRPESNQTVEFKLDSPVPSADKAKYELIVSINPNTGWQEGKRLDIDIRSVVGFDSRGRTYQLHTEPTGFLLLGKPGEGAEPATRDRHTLRFE